MRLHLRLSPAYPTQAHDAAVRGWHIKHLEGHHLDVLARARDVAAAVRRLLGR